MTRAQVALSCSKCRAVLKVAPVLMRGTTGDLRDGLDEGLRGIRRGVSVPAVCRRCGTPYDVASAKIFVEYGECVVENGYSQGGDRWSYTPPGSGCGGRKCPGNALAE